MKLKNLILGLMAMALVAVSCTQVPGAGDVEMKNETDSVSCALGYVIASQMKQNLASQFDTLYGESVAAAFAKSEFSEDMKKNYSESFDSINYIAMKAAFLNEMAYGKADFDETTANEFLRAAYQRAQDAKNMKPGMPAFDNKKKGDAFLGENGKRKGVVTTESGLQYEVVKEGKGVKPTPADKVEVTYKGTLIDGTEFDSGTTTFGVTQVIPGWVEGLQLMTKGAKYKFYIPSNLAYGANGPASIGPNSALVFEVELLNIVKGN